MTKEQIHKKANQIFDKLYTIDEIVKGDTIAMVTEARRLAVEELKKEEEALSERLELFEKMISEVFRYADRNGMLSVDRVRRIVNTLGTPAFIGDMSAFVRGKDLVSVRDTVIQISKENSRLRKKFFKEKAIGEQILNMSLANVSESEIKFLRRK